MARGIVRAGSRTSSPSVAMRAYPANAKNSSPADCSTPYQPTSPPASPPPRASSTAVARCASAAPPARQAATTTASTSSTTVTTTRVSRAVRVIPR